MPLDPLSDDIIPFGPLDLCPDPEGPGWVIRDRMRMTEDHHPDIKSALTSIRDNLLWERDMGRLEDDDLSLEAVTELLRDLHAEEN